MTEDKLGGFSVISTIMICHQDVCLHQLQELGTKFNWIRPACTCDRPKVWGHGCVLRFFDGFPHALSIRRFRCARCRRVFTMRPSAFYARFQTAIAAIFACLLHRLESAHWPAGAARQRAGHWLRAFGTKARVHFPLDQDLVGLLSRLHVRGAHMLV